MEMNKENIIKKAKERNIIIKNNTELLNAGIFFLLEEIIKNKK